MVEAMIISFLVAVNLYAWTLLCLAAHLRAWWDVAGGKVVTD